MSKLLKKEAPQTVACFKKSGSWRNEATWFQRASQVGKFQGVQASGGGHPLPFPSDSGDAFDYQKQIFVWLVRSCYYVLVNIAVGNSSPPSSISRSATTSFVLTDDLVLVVALRIQNVELGCRKSSAERFLVCGSRYFAPMFASDM